LTYKELTEKIQDYYGSYPEGSKIGNYVMSYLKRDIDESKLDKLFRYVTYFYPHRFGPPGIADIEKAINESIYKHKGDDVHKIKKYTTSELETITEEERKEADKLIEQAGGLTDMFGKVVEANRFKK
jgi:hypothetical protein